jgi:hypothetical protein
METVRVPIETVRVPIHCHRSHGDCQGSIETVRVPIHCNRSLGDCQGSHRDCKASLETARDQPPRLSHIVRLIQKRRQTVRLDEKVRQSDNPLPPY